MPSKNCSVERCNKDILYNNLCSYHYYQQFYQKNIYGCSEIKCKICGIKENLSQKKFKDGRIININYCKPCRSKMISEKQKNKISKKRGKGFEQMYGEEKAIEIKRKISNTLKGHKPWNKNISGYTTSLKGINYEKKYGKEKSEQIKKIISRTHLGKKITEEHKNKLRVPLLEQTKQKISLALKNKIKNEHFVPFKQTSVVYNNILFRSSWEVGFVKWCDKNNIKFFYEPKAFDLGENKIYIPDFYLPEIDMWIEIKGWWRKKALNKVLLFKEKISPRLHIIDFTNMYLYDERFIKKECFNTLGQYNIYLLDIINQKRGCFIEI
jgi:hypothetical protein